MQKGPIERGGKGAKRFLLNPTCGSHVGEAHQEDVLCIEHAFGHRSFSLQCQDQRAAFVRDTE